MSGSGWAEVVLVLGSLAAYGILCSTAPADRGAAVRHAWDVLSLEAAAGIDVEVPVNAWFVAHPLLATLANYFYTTVYSVTTLGTLALVWVCGRERYPFLRTSLFAMTALAALTYWTYPLAPPRLVPGAGFVDTVAAFGTWGGAYSSTTADVANIYGAMPSMHTGWALWVAWCVWVLFPRWWTRLLGLLLPAATIAVIVGTANHYVLDAVGGALALCLGIALTRGASALVDRWRTRHGDALSPHPTPSSAPSSPTSSSPTSSS